jgi:hypothetical protein
MSTYEFGDKRDHTWGTIKVGRKGWTVITYSRWIGSRSDSRVFVPFDAQGVGVAKNADLNADFNDHMTNADALRHFAASYTDRCRVIRRGDIVQ